MQSPPRELRRRIVPRWRSIARTPTPELENHRTQAPVDESISDELWRRVREWRERKTEESAQELVWASTVFGSSKITEKPLEELTSQTDLPSDVRDAARDLIAAGTGGGFELLLDFDSEELLRAQIRALKARIATVSHDPIQFVDLARLYCRIGQIDQAKKAFRIGFGLAPTSRFVLRAATRFLVHIQDFDEAIRIISHGNPSDPWIQATKISLLDLGKKTIRNVRKAREILDIDAAPKHLSELAASLATLEYESGNVSRAKKFFKQGGVDPNDNVVAQLQWASENKILEFKPELLERSLTFEARASFAKKEKKWNETLVHCVDWIQDEPMSARPAITASYVASELLQDYEKSTKFCEAGLLANPNDFTLLNNIAFNYAAMGNVEAAERFLAKSFLRMTTKEEEVVYLATSGMIKIRRGQLDAGIAEYEKSIELALAEKLPTLAQLAAVHYVSEFVDLGSFLSIQEVEQITNMMEDKKMIDEVHDVYLSRLKPRLIKQPEAGPPSKSPKLPKLFGF